MCIKVLFAACCLLPIENKLIKWCSLTRFILAYMHRSAHIITDEFDTEPEKSYPTMSPSGLENKQASYQHNFQTVSGLG